MDITDVREICRFLSHGPFGPMLHFGFSARVAGGLLIEGDEGQRPLLHETVSPLSLRIEREAGAS